MTDFPTAAAEEFVLAIAADELTWEQIAARLPAFAESTAWESPEG